MQDNINFIESLQTLHHQLEFTWVLWCQSKLDTVKWNDSLQKLAEFSTVEELWKLESVMLSPSLVFSTAHLGLSKGPISGFSLFKKGISPAWEDPCNTDGGELICRTPLTPQQLDLYWELLVLGIIGNTIEIGDEICGCRIVDKTNKGSIMFKFEVWLRTKDDVVAETIRLLIMRCFEQFNEGEERICPLDFSFVKDRS